MVRRSAAAITPKGGRSGDAALTPRSRRACASRARRAAPDNSAERAGSEDCSRARLDLVAQPLVGEPVVVLAAPAGDDVVAIGALPAQAIGSANSIAHLVEISRALDRVRDRREEDVRVADLDVFDGGGDVLELLAFVAPHEEHADLDAVLRARAAQARRTCSTVTPRCMASRMLWLPLSEPIQMR